ncbi:MAG: hypothetical protein H0T63_04665 [Pyrinomonadaceae bacterium]|jgi:hypothetical protein|nr:hypothetical protein [Pyrinomonadaceae bacterium]
MDYIDELRVAIRRLHGCEAEHVETVPVKETFRGQTVWQGEVEVFNIRGHPKAKRAYAWSHERDKGKRYVAVLEIPPVDSAQAAVRAAIVQENRSAREKTKKGRAS